MLQEKLNNDSIKEKQLINNVKRYWNYQIETITEELSFFTNQIFDLKKLRKTKSADLQHYLFEQYQFLNSKKGNVTIPISSVRRRSNISRFSDLQKLQVSKHVSITFLYVWSDLVY